MKQSTVRALLSRLTEQLVLYFSEDGKITDTKEFSERLAMGTWDGLILLLRQSIANSDEVLLEEVGLFRKIEDHWSFRPAASLLEVDAIKLEETERQMYLAQKALFHLQQGADLLTNVADDQELPSQPEADTPEIEILAALGADIVRDPMLSDRIEKLGTRLTRTARRLRGEIAAGRVGGLTGMYSADRSPQVGKVSFEEGKTYTIGSDTVSKVSRERAREAYEAGERALEAVKRAAELKAESNEAEIGQTEP